MPILTPDRRSLLKGGATMLAAAATMSSEQLLGYAKAWAQTAQWKPEADAKINLLRWKRFVEAEDVAFMKVESSSYMKIRLDILYSVYVVFAVAIIIRYVWAIVALFRGEAPEEADITKATSGL